MTSERAVFVPFGGRNKRQQAATPGNTQQLDRNPALQKPPRLGHLWFDDLQPKLGGPLLEQEHLLLAMLLFVALQAHLHEGEPISGVTIVAMPARRAGRAFWARR
jgi:hypothetical protein